MALRKYGKYNIPLVRASNKGSFRTMKKIFLHKVESQVARHGTIRDINRRIVLNFVRARSPISRADIARASSLQRSTVSAIVDDLLADGSVEETGSGRSTGGRKPKLLRLRTGNPVAIGVDVTPRKTVVVSSDLAGNVLSRDEFATSGDISFMNSQIESRVLRLVRESPDASLEIGMTVPGIADPTTRKIHYVPYFQLSDWDIADRLADVTGLPVFVDNDANAVALAELWFGADEMRTTRNFITVMVAEGIGTGIIIDGQVYRGQSGAAGEFGHMFLAEGGSVLCSCGRSDCWEAHASEKAILESYQADNGPGALRGSPGIDQLIDLARNGEARALTVLSNAVKNLGIGISNLMIGFSPQAIVVSGGIVKAWDLIVDDLNTIGRRTVRGHLTSAAIVPSSLGPEPTVLGSITLVLSRKFASVA